MNIIGKKKVYIGIAVLLLVICIVSLLTIGLKTGVEFSSGSILTVGFESEISSDQLRSFLASTEDYSGALIQRTGTGDFIIRTEEMDEAGKNALVSTLQTQFGTLEVKEFDNVSSMIANETTRNAIIAVVIAAAAMLLYIAWAFRKMPNPFRFGSCAIAGLILDTFLALGVFSIVGKFLGWEINLMFITGVLAVIGYSINNTVVVFDRIRENVSRGIHADFGVVVNTSVVQTLARSVNTSLTTLLTLFTLILFVGSSIQNFVIVLIIGVISGVFNSTCVAPGLLVLWNEKSKKADSSKMAEARARS